MVRQLKNVPSEGRKSTMVTPCPRGVTDSLTHCGVIKLRAGPRGEHVKTVEVSGCQGVAERSRGHRRGVNGFLRDSDADFI